MRRKGNTEEDAVCIGGTEAMTGGEVGHSPQIAMSVGATAHGVRSDSRGQQGASTQKLS